MDGELLRWLYHRLLHDPTLARTPDCTCGDGLVAFIYFFAPWVLSGRSPKWACDRQSWPPWCRAVLPQPLISYAQHNRRLKTDALRELVARLNEELRDRLPRGAAKVVDGKPLVVGGYSHDRDAAWGKVPDGWANGYKLHVVIDAAGGAIDACEL